LPRGFANDAKRPRPKPGPIRAPDPVGNLPVVLSSGEAESPGSATEQPTSRSVVGPFAVRLERLEVPHGFSARPPTSVFAGSQPNLRFGFPRGGGAAGAQLTEPRLGVVDTWLIARSVFGWWDRISEHRSNLRLSAPKGRLCQHCHPAGVSVGVVGHGPALSSSCRKGGLVYVPRLFSSMLGARLHPPPDRLGCGDFRTIRYRRLG